MSMLRRPLTQLELCEDDIQWLSDQLAKKDAPLIDQIKCEAMDVDEEEPMDQSEPPAGISRRSLRSSGRKKDTPGPSSSSGECTRTTAISSTARTPVATPSLSLSTPVNAVSSNELLPAAPPARLVRPVRRPRGSRNAGEIDPPLFNAFDTPQQAGAAGTGDSPTPSDSPESPNAHLYATPNQPAPVNPGGGPSSNTRSHRH